MTEADEPAFIGRLRQGDHEAWRSLFERYAADLGGRVWKHLPAALRHRSGVSDVLQEAHFAAYEARGDFVGDTLEGFRRWLLGIAEHKALDAVRRHEEAEVRSVRREEAMSDTAAALEVPGLSPTPSEVAIAGELADLASRARERLSDDHREVLRLVSEEGLSLAEVAERLGKSREAVKKLYGRAVVGFRREFDRLRGGER